MTKPIRREDKLQKALVQHLKFRCMAGIVWFSVPNEGKRSARYGARLKAMGMRPGVADMVFIIPGRMPCFMELKAPRGQQTETQMQFQQDVELIGCGYALIRDIDAGIRCLEEWGVVQ